MIIDDQPLQLSNVTVDYNTIDAAFVQDLQLQGSWSSLLPSATGSALRRWMTSVTAFLMGGIARALQEAFPDTARTPGGVLRAQRLYAGGGIIRTRAGSLTGTVNRTDSVSNTLVVPAYQGWRVGAATFFNRTSVVVPASGSAAVTLYQGSMASQTEISDGTGFQRFVIGTPDLWDLSNDDLYAVDANGATWTFVTSGLWKLAGTAQQFRASTLPDGTVECRFGDGNYGAAPPVGPLVFYYASLQTAIQSTNGPLLGSTILPLNTSYTLTGSSTSIAAPNQDRPQPEFYKAMGTGAASNNGRAVSGPDYLAVALQYDGVIDACFRGQAQLNPSDIRFMNIVAVSLLTSAPWTNAQWIAFKQYMEQQVAISNVYLIRDDPTPVPISYEITIGASLLADDNSLTALVGSVLANYYTPRAGIMGSTVYPSDAILQIAENATYQQAPNESGSLVDYIDVVQPRTPIKLTSTSYPVLGNVVVNVVPSTRGPNSSSTGPVLT